MALGASEAAHNQRWSLDFIADTLSDGRRFRILCVVDDFSRDAWACVVDTSLSDVRVVRELKRPTGERAAAGYSQRQRQRTDYVAVLSVGS